MTRKQWWARARIAIRQCRDEGNPAEKVKKIIAEEGGKMTQAELRKLDKIVEDIYYHEGPQSLKELLP
jgi:hypothetical protein